MKKTKQLTKPKHPLTLFDPAFVEITERLKAGGCSDDDIAFVLGVYDHRTIERWASKYPNFRQAIDSGKEIARQELISKGMKLACGYDYDEENEKWVTTNKIDEEGNPVMVLKERSKYHRHHPPDGKLLLAFLARLDPEFRKMYQRTVDSIRRQVEVKVSGKLEAEKINKLFGKLLEGSNSEDAARKPCISITSDTEISRKS